MAININGIKVFTEGDTALQPIVFVHGFPFDHTIWDKIIEALHHDYYCVSYDLRGLGDSDVGDGQYTIEGHADDLDTIISKLDLDGVILCGFSMGGYIALRANERFKNFKALILANTTTASDNDEAKIKRAKAMQDINTNGVMPFLESFFSVAFSEDYLAKHSDEIVHLKQKISTFSPIGIKGALLAMACRTDTTKSLQYAPRSLFIASSDDAIIPSQTMKDISKEAKNGQFVEIPNSGHVSMLEQPKEFINALKSFLDSIEN